MARELAEEEMERVAGGIKFYTSEAASYWTWFRANLNFQEIAKLREAGYRIDRKILSDYPHLYGPDACVISKESGEMISMQEICDALKS